MKKQLILITIAISLASTYIALQSNVTNTTASPIVNSANIVSYANDVQPILERRCGKCHMGEFTSEGLNMESYESLMAGSQNGQVVIAGDSGNSLITEKLESGEMPKRGSNLTAEQIELIKQWIDEGALNN